MRNSTAIGIAAAVIVFTGGAALTAIGAMRMVAHRTHGAPIVYEPAAHPKVVWHGTVGRAEHEEIEEDDADGESGAEPKLPTVARDVPIFQARLLDGCSKTDLDRVSKSIDDAINVGAPLYNDGDFAGCYGTYESAARTIERDVGKTCKGPANALEEARQRAKKRKTPAESAWAMRDSFDGILDIIERRGPEL